MCFTNPLPKFKKVPMLSSVCSINCLFGMLKKRLCDSLLLIYACNQTNTPPPPGRGTSPESQAMLLSHNALDMAQSHSLAKIFQRNRVEIKFWLSQRTCMCRNIPFWKHCNCFYYISLDEFGVEAFYSFAFKVANNVHKQILHIS